MTKKILVIDDDESILDAVSLILEENDYEVKSTLKAEEAYPKAIEFQPDLILLDVLLSGKDGREICKDLKEQSETKDIPVVMISAHPSARASVKEFGADDFIAKPFQVEDLLSSVEKHIN
jgi:DNA-binding response OmpR family regulator